MLVSIVTPTRNSAALIPKHYTDVSTVLAQDGCAFEITYVDDGSHDSSASVITRLSEQDDRVRGIFIGTRHGQQTAVSVGFVASRGDVVITLDVDLQIPARVLPLIVREILRGTDYVPVVRVRRARRGIVRDVGSRCFNWYMRARTGLPIRDFGSGSGGLSKDLIRRMTISDLPHRGLKHLASQLATSIVYLPVEEVQVGGRSSYSTRGLARAFWVEHRLRTGLDLPDPSTVRMTR